MTPNPSQYALIAGQWSELNEDTPKASSATSPNPTPLASTPHPEFASSGI
jgi:hypothetical protein